MTAPTAPIDADLGEWDKISYFPLELDTIWRTQNLADAGASAWTQMWAVASFPASLGTGLVLDRIRCAPGTPLQIVNAIGHALKPDGVTWAEFCGRSQSNGATWNWTEIGEIEDPSTNSFSLGNIQSASGPQSLATFSGGGGQILVNVHFWVRTDPQSQWTQTVASQELVFSTALPAGTLTLEFDLIGETPSIGYDTDGDQPPYITNGVGSWTGTVGNWHFSGTVPGGVSSLYLGWWSGGGASAGRWDNGNESIRICRFSNLIIDGVAYAASVSKAFDIYRGNPNVMFYGSTDKIYTSTDGGFTWDDIITAYGAYDICIDPQLGGVFYAWNSLEQLICVIAGIPSIIAGVTGGSQGQFLQIARDFNTGKLWVIDSLGNLKMRNLAVWTTQKSGLMGGCGLRAFYASPTKLALLDDSDIYLSLDAGATWANKKGGWAAFANPKTIHLLEAPP